MREIKFRAWDWKTEKMFNVAAICLHGSPVITLQYSPVIKRQLDNVVLMQFTGLQDKNGVYIYEGDIFMYFGKECLLEWCDGGYEVRSAKGFFERHLWLTTSEQKIEVIGNIHENPELLEA